MLEYISVFIFIVDYYTGLPGVTSLYLCILKEKSESYTTFLLLGNTTTYLKLLLLSKRQGKQTEIHQLVGRKNKTNVLYSGKIFPIFVINVNP